jgi:membrane-associated protein
VAGVAMTLETSAFIGLLVPGDAVVVLAATGVTSVASGAALVAVVVIGALIGESLGYLLGRWFGPALQRSRVGRLLPAEHWERGQRYVQRRGGSAIFLSRFIPVLHSTVPMIAGTSGFRYRTFLAWTAPACVLWATLYVIVGSVAASVFRDLSATLGTAGLILLAGGIVLAVSVVLVKRLILRRESRHFEPTDGPAPAPDVAV